MFCFCTRTFFVVIVLVLSFSCSEQADRYLANGKQHMQNKKWADAELQFRKVLQSEPRNAEAHLELGKSLFEQSKGAEAYREISEAVRLNPKGAEAKRLYQEMTLAAYVADPQRPADRLQILARMAEAELKSDSASYEGWRLSGLLARTSGRRQEAVEAFRKALAAKPGDEDVSKHLAQVLAQDPATEAEAVSTWEATISQHPKSWPAYEELGAYYQRKSNFEAAEKVLRKAMLQFPGSSSPYTRLSEVYRQAGKRSEAEALLLELASNESKIPDGRLAAGDAFYAANDLNAALREYQAAWKSSGPQRLSGGKRALRTLSALGRMDEARILLKEILAIAPKDIEVEIAEALLELDRNEIGAAIVLLNKLIAEHPANSAIRFHLGRAHSLKGDATKAISAWREAVRLSPGSPEPRLELAKLALQMGRPNEALEVCNTVLQLEPSHPEGLHLRVVALQGLGRWTEARTALDDFRKQHPRHSAVELDEAAFLLKDRKFAEAERRFKKHYHPGATDLNHLMGYARALVAQKKAPEALRLVQEEAQRSPANRLLQYFLADTYAVNGKAAEAKTTLTALLAADPKFYLAGMRLGLIYLEEGNAPEALRILEATRKESPEHIEPVSLIAQVHERTGNRAGAKSAYREWIKAQPQNPVAALGLASLIADHGSDSELAEALRLAQFAKSAAPGEVRALDTLGRVYLRRNEKQLAAQEFQAALRQQPNDPRIKQHLAAALRN